MADLKIACININSLAAKIVELREHIEIQKYDIICVTETKLNENILDNAVLINNFNLFRRDRLSDTVGGGVAVYINSSWQVSEIEEFFDDNICYEQLWLKCIIDKKPYVIGVIYRQPKQPLLEFIRDYENVMMNVLASHENIICTGDFNIDLLSDTAASRHLNNLLESFGLTQYVTQPTRISKTSATLLDLVICTDSINVCDCDVLHDEIKSDHSLVKTNILIDSKTEIVNKIRYRNFKKIDKMLFETELRRLPFENILLTNNIDSKVSILTTLILQIFDTFAPIHSVVLNKQSKPWITDNIKLLFKLRDNALRRFKRTKREAHWDYYKLLRNFTNRAVNNEKKAYLRYKLSNKTSPKLLYKELKKLNVYCRKSNSNIPDELSDVEMLNDFFIKSAKSQHSPNLNILNKLINSKKEVSLFSFKEVNDNVVYSRLLSIKSNAIGADEVGLDMLLYCCPYIIKYLTHIINTSINSATFPSQWKAVHVLPLSKVKNPTQYKDIRPISILCTAAKIYEKVLYEQIQRHLDDNQIIPSNQSGFRRNYSCNTTLLSITDDIIAASDNNLLTILVLLDYSKAFDRINHQLLLGVLHFIGFSDTALDLVRNYLSDRFQRVKLHNRLSSPKNITNGVPQGSILGPLFFCIYTCLFQDCLQHCRSHFYADDTQLYISFPPKDFHNNIKNITRDLTALFQLSNDYCLDINSSKSKTLLFGRKHCRLQYKDQFKIIVNNETLPTSEISKNLGLFLDTDLRFVKHVNEIIKKCMTNIKMIYANKYILTHQAKRTLCESLVFSHMHYCDSVYGPCVTRYDSQRLQRMQNICIRLVYNLKKRQGVSAKRFELSWLSVQEARFLHTCCLYRKIVNLKTPPYLYNKIRFRSDVHNINIRRKDDISIPRHSTAMFKSSFSYLIGRILNLIPIEFKKLSHVTFKNKLKFLLLRGQLLIDFKI